MISKYHDSNFSSKAKKVDCSRRMRFFVIISFLWYLNSAIYLSQYEDYGEDFVHMLDGMFSFVLLDTRDKSFIAARDAIGITPLYMGWGLDGM